MKSFVSNILAPYFNTEKERLSLDQLQECIWQLDIWSVHASLEFRTWMFDNYPWIILDYVPGGCTGLWQPCDVGIQRILKLAVKHSQQTAVVHEVSSQLQTGINACDVTLDTTLGTLRNRVPATLVNAYHSINKPQRIQKASYSFRYHNIVSPDNGLQAFELCRSGEFNLSHLSLTSRPLRVILDNLPQQDAALAEAISAPCKHPTTDDSGTRPNSAMVMNEGGFTEPVEDDVEVTLEEVCEHLDGGGAPEGLAEVNGGLQLGSAAAEGDDVEIPIAANYGLGRGK
ncbi:uncharacterized protein EI90DRAFT_2956475 [Cantharellus anzutake]|uniref:uncharacterized protein n=1 Tax=Cantharellus anzutake TaxID=1750568 RepID=UPI001905FABE|nr:uncharacterized protein EI90DRAFT_2956475 [Cantharellus anzutake]KAF8310445.1 hypothetical protein EI90DRAFT_2956475 [Cantharellus anzutake]